MNNIVMTANDSLNAIKAAIKDGHSFFVVEGFGTPINFRFLRNRCRYDQRNGPRDHERGCSRKPRRLLCISPEVYSKFPGMNTVNRPEIWADLIYVDPATGLEKIVASAKGANQEINYSDPITGYYRAHIYMKPHHLKEYLFDDRHADELSTGLSRNHIQVNRT